VLAAAPASASTAARGRPSASSREMEQVRGRVFAPALVYAAAVLLSRAAGPGGGAASAAVGTLVPLLLAGHATGRWCQDLRWGPLAICAHPMWHAWREGGGPGLVAGAAAGCVLAAVLCVRGTRDGTLAGGRCDKRLRFHLWLEGTVGDFLATCTSASYMTARHLAVCSLVPSAAAAATGGGSTVVLAAFAAAALVFYEPCTGVSASVGAGPQAGQRQDMQEHGLQQGQPLLPATPPPRQAAGRGSTGHRQARRSRTPPRRRTHTMELRCAR
jgi:hypothetical protein